MFLQCSFHLYKNCISSTQLNYIRHQRWRSFASACQCPLLLCLPEPQSTFAPAHYSSSNLLSCTYIPDPNGIHTSPKLGASLSTTTSGNFETEANSAETSTEKWPGYTKINEFPKCKPFSQKFLRFGRKIKWN